MFFLFSAPYFLIRPTAYCNLSGNWRECSHDEICNNIHTDLSYYFDKPVEFNFVTELNWYCEPSASSYYTATSFFAGTTVSVVLVTAVSDTLGRMPLLITGVTGSIFAIVLFMFHTTPMTCLITSFLVGFFTMANNSTSFNYLADSIPEKYREIFPSLMNTGWAIGEIVIALVMWTQVQWRVMGLIMVLFAATFFIPLIWLRESPKFYFVKNQLFKAKRRLNSMARVNKVHAYDVQLVSAESLTDKKEELSFSRRLKLMCCDEHMLIQIIIVTLLFSIGNMAFYAMALNLENMGANPYINGISLAIAEIFAYTISAVSLNKLGMKISLSGSFVITNIGLAGLFFLWENPFGCLVFAFIGKFGSAAVDNLLYTMSGMIFPTEILGSALGIALLGTRAGNSLAKPLILLGYKMMCILMLGLGIFAVVLSAFMKTKKKEDKSDIAEVNPIYEGKE
jgi:MFS family permease